MGLRVTVEIVLHSGKDGKIVDRETADHRGVSGDRDSETMTDNGDIRLTIHLLCAWHWAKGFLCIIPRIPMAFLGAGHRALPHSWVILHPQRASQHSAEFTQLCSVGAGSTGCWERGYVIICHVTPSGVCNAHLLKTCMESHEATWYTPNLDRLMFILARFLPSFFVKIYKY